jgi:hypothetical protein
MFKTWSVRRRLLSLSVLAAIPALIGVNAFQTWAASTVAVYTGCLSNSSGAISSVAAGNSPLSPCNSTQTIIHFSGGTITSVNAGTGLTGGGTNGDVTLAVSPSYRLPQACSNGQFPSWNGTTWTCGTQNTYSGTNFALSNQACATDKFVAGVDSSGLITCDSPKTHSLVTTEVTGPTVLLCSYADPTCPNFGYANSNTSTASCPSGTLVTGGGYTSDAGFYDWHITSNHAGPSNSWVVSATNDDLFSGMHLTAFAECTSLS